jgi:ABC-type branched-subunit amino acid transport system ATPase component
VTDYVLELADVSAGYTRAPVIRDINVSVRAGEVVGILGPNGAGKTTTLRVASGLHPPQAGRVLLMGTDVTGVSAQRLAVDGLAHVPEGRGVFSGLTVEEHLRLAARGTVLDRARAYELFPPLRALRRRKAGLLSGGEQQMLSLARALCRSPRVLLIDEMSLGLAPIIVARLLASVRAFADDGGAVIMVEQHVSLALRHVDRAYVLSHGEVVHHDQAERLRANQELVLASYMGERSLAR